MRLSWVGGALAVALGAIGMPSAPASAEVGEILGTVTIQTPGAGQRPPRYYRGPYRAAHAEATRPAPAQSVVLFVEDVPEPVGGWPVADEPAAMRQRGDRFVPHVLPVIAGSRVSFPNDDNYYHNVFSVVAGDRFDLGRYGQGDTREQTFTEPAVVVVRCEIHPGMKAYILVLANPHFATPDAHGRFRLPRVAAGTWSVTAWHPTRGHARRQVTVPAAGRVTVDFSF